MSLHRRDVLLGGAAAAAAWSGLASPTRSHPPTKAASVRYCLNTSTIRGQKLSVADEIEIAATAGYDGVEPWLNKLKSYRDSGGSLTDLRKRIADLGLRVESAIGFGRWIVDDDEARRRGLEDAKEDMEIVRAIGGSRIAAPPAGATREPGLDLFRAAERFGELVDAGRELGVEPQLELWGFSKNLSRLGELMMVAAECGRERVHVLPDVYHIYKGGSDFAGLDLIAGEAIQVFHMNDYPLDPPRETANDAIRVYPGDGEAPLDRILQTLKRNGFQGALSLELFNPNYWKQDALTVAQTGLTKMKAAVDAAWNEA